MRVRLATRRSRLALVQAQLAREALEAASPGLEVVLVQVDPSGDRMQEVPLEGREGTGFFIDRLEQALVEGAADLAVHSLKDVPVTIGAQFEICAMLARADPRDALVSPHGGMADLPAGARIGTDSGRRRSQLSLLRPDLSFAPVRGNVPTRLAKLDRGDYDGLVLAVAGLARLDLSDRISQPLEPRDCLPAPGQGAIAIEALVGSDASRLARTITDPETVQAVAAERAVLAGLGGGCESEVGALARVTGSSLRLEAGVFRDRPRRVAVEGPSEAGESLGREAASLLMV